MRLPRLYFVRTLAALAIAFSSPGADVTHGLAHDNDHDSERTAHFAHHDVIAAQVEDRASDHAHHTASEAIGMRAGLSAFISSEAVQVLAGVPEFSSGLLLPISDSKRFGNRDTGPPPRLRAPPLD